MYIAPGQGLTTPWGQNFYVKRNILSLSSFVASLKKKNLWSLILYILFHDFIHVYSSGVGADNPQWKKFWCQQKCLVTSFICCKFQKNVWSLILYNSFHDLIHVYSPKAGADSPQGTKFWCQQKGLIISPICCKCQRNFFDVWFYEKKIPNLIHVYSPGAGDIQPPGDKVLMSTETSCHFGHLLLVSNHRHQ